MKIKFILLLFVILLIISTVKAQVTANYNASDSTGCNPFMVQFNDLSTGNIASWQWIFSDGQNSWLQNPVMTFNGTGYISVTLIVTESGTGTTDTLFAQDLIQVVCSPHASFQLNGNNMGCIPLDVSFTDLSTNSDGVITNWSWDMGDGNILTDQNPTTTYNSPGIFNVYLQVVNEYGCIDDTTINNIVFASTVPDINIAADITQYCAVPVDIHFTNNSTGSANQTDFLWDFGDGNTSIDENPVNTYDSLGLFDITLTVTDEYGCSNTDTFPNFIQLNQIVADFTTNPVDTVCLGEQVEFVNLSGIYCNWYFGDGATMLNVSVDTVTHTYVSPGLVTITLIAAPGDLCADTITKDIYVQQVSASFIANQTSDCKVPFTVNFFDQSSSNAAFWNWNFGNGDTSTLQNPSNTFNSFGDYDVSLTVTTSAGCSIGINLQNYIQIHPPIANFTVDPPNGGCVPIILHFEDNSSSTSPINDWQWTFQGGNPASGSGDTISSLYTTDGTFAVTLIITNDSNCTATIIDSIEVGSHQILDFALSTDTICASDTMSFFNFSQDTNLIDTWDWQFSTEFEPQEMYVYADGVASDTGFTNIQLISNYNGCRDTLNIDSALYVYGPIVTSITPTFRCDSSYIVSFDLGYIDAEDWDWDFDDGTIIYNSTMDSISHTYDTIGTYWVRVTTHNSASGCDYEDSVQIRVTDVQAVLDIPAENCQGQPFNISAINSVDAQSYYYDCGDGSTFGWTASSIYSNFSYSYPGEYVITLIVRDIHMCYDTITDTILSSNPIAQITVDTTMGCAPLEVTLNSDSCSSPFGISAYTWVFMDGTPNANDSDIVHTYMSEGIYNLSLSVQDSAGCVSTVSQMITVYEAHAQIIPEDTTLCVEVPVSFYGGNTLQTYVWNFGDFQTANGDTVSNTYSNDTIFVVQQIATESHGCLDTAYQTVDVQGVDVMLTVVDSVIECYVTSALSQANIENYTSTDYAATWQWSFGDGTYSTNFNPGHYYQQPGDYYVLLQATTAYGCSDIDSVFINTFGPYAVFSLPDDTLCRHEEFTIDLSDTMNIVDINGTFGDGSGFSYFPYTYNYDATGWMNVDINLYSDASHQCGAALHDSLFVVEVIADFQVSDISSSDTANCSPFTIDFTNNSLGLLTTWNWDLGDGSSDNAYTPANHTYYNTNVQDQTYVIELSIANNSGCVDTVTHQIIVYGTPEINVSDDQFICKGDSIQLNATGGSYIIWLPNQGINNPYSYNPFVYPDTSTLYNITVYSTHACQNDDSVMITVQNAPTVTYSPDTTIIIGDIADLFVYANQPNVIFNWLPAYGLSCLNCTDVYAQPLETTTYQILYQDSMQCFTQAVNITVFVKEEYTIDVPTAFTPDGDGNNDVVYVKGWGIKNLLEFSIYNRWGEQIFTTDDINQGWDGTFKGKPQNIDTYVYYTKGMLYSGKEVEKKGTINLFR